MYFKIECNCRQASTLLLSAMFAICVYVSSAAEDEDGFHTFSKSEYPNPFTEPQYCGRQYPSSFCNPGGILSSKRARELDSILRTIANDTGCICEKGCQPDRNGLLFGVALLNTAEKYDSTYLREFADYLREKWQLGECKNDVLILVVIKRGLITISMGENAYNALPRDVFDVDYKLKDDIKSNNHTRLAHALETITQSYYQRIKNLKLTVDSVKSAIPSVILVIAVVFAAFILLICCFGFICYLRRKCRKKRKVQDIEDAESSSIGKLKRGFGGSRDAYHLKNDSAKEAFDNRNEKYIQYEKEAQSVAEKDAESSGQGSDASEDEDEAYSEEDEEQSHRSLPTPSPLKSEANEFKGDKHG